MKGEDFGPRLTSENTVETPITEFDPECGILQFNHDATETLERCLMNVFNLLYYLKVKFLFQNTLIQEQRLTSL